MELALLLVSPVDGMVQVGSLPSVLGSEAGSFCLCLFLFLDGLDGLLEVLCWLRLLRFVEFFLT